MSAGCRSITSLTRRSTIPRSVGYYLARTDQEAIRMGISPETGRPEHHESRWVDFDTAYDLAAPRVRMVVRWARQILGD